MFVVPSLPFALSTLGIAIKGATSFSSPKGKTQFFKLIPTTHLAHKSNAQRQGQAWHLGGSAAAARCHQRHAVMAVVAVAVAVVAGAACRQRGGCGVSTATAAVARRRWWQRGGGGQRASEAQISFVEAIIGTC